MTAKSVPPTFARALNVGCECITTDDALLRDALAEEGASFGDAELVASHPHLFSRSAVFVEPEALEAMAAVVRAVERVVALPAYIEQALADAHPHARLAQKARGAFLGYDFHLGDDGPRLIEINTNPGGGLLNAVLRRAQRACCDEVRDAFGVGPGDARQRLFETFLSEWRLARGAAPLARVAIVDDGPEGQYLHPEFVLFERLFAMNGIEAVIADARELAIEGDRLVHRGMPIDLVYNRSTDFSLEEPAHAALAEAYREDLAIVVPHPRAHALYADKRRLVTLSSPDALAALGVAPEDAALLTRYVPSTIVVDPLHRETLWRDRKQLFFKPASGYGSKAAYRGDKLTKGAFEELLRAPYVAQALVPPSARAIRVGEERRELKL
ncbi:MAG: hypothetical protein H5U40_08645, partial [Polyangiaceae bacterium]|nr:hypothetical protein [Polyangiaceae bacterium]